MIVGRAAGRQDSTPKNPQGVPGEFINFQNSNQPQIMSKASKNPKHQNSLMSSGP